jgi:hypothetical protein
MGNTWSTKWKITDVYGPKLILNIIPLLDNILQSQYKACIFRTGYISTHEPKGTLSENQSYSQKELNN